MFSAKQLASIPVLYLLDRFFRGARLVAIADECLARPLAYRRHSRGQLGDHRVPARQVGARVQQSNLVGHNRLRPIVLLVSQTYGKYAVILTRS